MDRATIFGLLLAGTALIGGRFLEGRARGVEFAYRARREGMLSLERDLPGISDPFFRRGLQLVIDGHNHQKVQEVLEVELEHMEENGLVPARVFENPGG